MNANETSTLDTPEQNQTQSLIAAMELLQEIKTEVLEISNTKDNLKENIQVSRKGYRDMGRTDRACHGADEPIPQPVQAGHNRGGHPEIFRG